MNSSQRGSNRGVIFQKALTDEHFFPRQRIIGFIGKLSYALKDLISAAAIRGHS